MAERQFDTAPGECSLASGHAVQVTQKQFDTAPGECSLVSGHAVHVTRSLVILTQ